jgi:hypothetical protein
MIDNFETFTNIEEIKNAKDNQRRNNKPRN